MAWRELAERVEAEVRQATVEEQVVFCAGVAGRLMAQHEALAPGQRRPFTLECRPLLDAVWDAACGDKSAFTRVKLGLAAYYVSGYCHNDGQDGPDDADDHAAAAVIHAAECYLHGLADFAGLVSQRGCDAADLRAQNAAADNAGDATAFVDSDPQILAELERQLADLRLIRRFGAQLHNGRWGLPDETVELLRRELRGPLSRIEDPRGQGQGSVVH